MTSCLNIERQWYKNCGRRRKRWVHLSYSCSRLSCLSKSVGTASWTAPKGTSYITWNFIGKTGGLIRVVANSGGLTGLAPYNWIKLTVHCIIPLLCPALCLCFFLGYLVHAFSSSSLFIGGETQCSNEYWGVFTANDIIDFCLFVTVLKNRSIRSN